MEQKILTPRQQDVLRIIADNEELAQFYLAGGTALSAFYFQHRLSDDLDFFSFQEVDTRYIQLFATKLQKQIGATKVHYKKLHDRNLFFFVWSDEEELKMEFSHYPFAQFEKPRVKDGIKYDSLRDIAAGKLMALTSRFDPKDFVDMYFLLQNRDLQDIIADVQIKFGMNMSALFVGGEFAKVKRIQALPKMFKSLTVEELKEFFAQKSQEIGEYIIK